MFDGMNIVAGSPRRRAASARRQARYRQGGMNAESARVVVGGGDHAAAAAFLWIRADGHRKIFQRRIDTFLHCGIERVHVDVNDDAHGQRIVSC